jgi:hypothetical protein
VPLRGLAMWMTVDTPDFGAVTSFECDQATIALRGSVENIAAFDLGAIVDVATDRKPTSKILDLTKQGFMGTAGLVAVSNPEKRLEAMGVRPMIQSPSTLLYRVLGIKGRG